MITLISSSESLIEPVTGSADSGTEPAVDGVSGLVVVNSGTELAVGRVGGLVVFFRPGLFWW